MAEPTASTAFGLTAISVALLGPLAGPYALIAFGALSGAMWPLSAATTLGKAAGAMLLVRCTLTALLLTAFLSSLLDSWLNVAGLDKPWHTSPGDLWDWAVQQPGARIVPDDELRNVRRA